MSLRAAALALLFTGCYQELEINDPDGSPPPWDAAAFDAGAAFVPPAGRCVESTGIDLLLVVDNSNSMNEEQASFGAALPRLVRALIEPPDADVDGEPDWLPVSDLNVGVITADLGTGGFEVPDCEGSSFGDDAILRTRGRTDLSGCAATYPPFVHFDPDADSPEGFARNVACVAQTGTGGCGYEQPLEAALKALAPTAPTDWTGPDYVPERFFRDTFGHGDGANAGLVRAETLLAVVVVTDEEDCSARDPELFDPSSTTYAGGLNIRCHLHADQALHPIERYVRGLGALRASRPDLIAFGLIAGVPPDLSVSQPSAADFEAILTDERMQERVDSSMPDRLVPSCDLAGRGLAFPPRRLVEVARDLTGARSTVQSICQEDLTGAAEALARLFGTRACAAHME